MSQDPMIIVLKQYEAYMKASLYIHSCVLSEHLLIANRLIDNYRALFGHLYGADKYVTMLCCDLQNARIQIDYLQVNTIHHD